MLLKYISLHQDKFLGKHLHNLQHLCSEISVRNLLHLESLVPDFIF